MALSKQQKDTFKKIKKEVLIADTRKVQVIFHGLPDDVLRVTISVYGAMNNNDADKNGITKIMKKHGMTNLRQWKLSGRGSPFMIDGIKAQ